MATDRLTLTRALEGGGIPRDAAEHIATQIFDAIHDNVATKADIQRLEARIDLVEHRLLIRLGSVVAAATGILIAIHYIH